MSERSNERQVAMEPTIAHNTNVRAPLRRAVLRIEPDLPDGKRRVLLLSSQLTKYAF